MDIEGYPYILVPDAPAPDTTDAADTATEPRTMMDDSLATPEAPSSRHRCSFCPAIFTTHAERQSHFHRTHSTGWTCPECHKHMKQRGRHGHGAKASKPAKTAKAAPMTTAAPPPSEGPIIPMPAPYTALRTAEQALQGVRGYIAKLEEENKLLKREIATLEQRFNAIEALFQAPAAAKPPRR